MATGRLLIIAPDDDLRRSLAFALEAEGYAIAAYARIADAPEPEGYDCTVLDHRATSGSANDVLEFCRHARPVVLLAGTPLPWLDGHVFRVVQKPLLGEPLSRAVRDALTSSGKNSSPK